MRVEILGGQPVRMTLFDLVEKKPILKSKAWTAWTIVISVVFDSSP